MPAPTSVRVGQLGAGFIGQMHSLAFRDAAFSRASPPVRADLVAIGDRDLPGATGVAERFGWAHVEGAWEPVLDHGLDLFVNAGPNALHDAPTVAAAARGVHVFSEKPLAVDAETAYRIWQDVEAHGVRHRCAFVQRYVPAIQLARELVRDGAIGEVRHVRSRFLMDMLGDGAELSWRFDRRVAGVGAVGDLGSHHIDLARFIVGEVVAVQASTATWSTDPTGRVEDVNDDWFACVAQLETGATATFEASRVAAGHALTGTLEIDGTTGSLAFSMERLNELVIREAGGTPRVQMVTRADDPYAGFRLPPGLQGNHPLGWNDCFAHQAHDVLAHVATGHDAGIGATFRDGYRVAQIVDAIVASAADGTRRPVTFAR